MNDLKGKTSKFNICDLLIVVLMIGVFFSNYSWLKIDQYPVEGHGLLGVIPAAQVYMYLKGVENTSKNYDQIFGMYNWCLFYPPLSFLVLVIFYLLFGLQGQMVVMINFLYITITLLCIYLIGKDMFNKSTGLLSALILSSFPGFIDFSHQYWIEFGLMAYVCLVLYFILKTNFFENRRYSVFLGIFLALSFLHKPEFVSFIIGPLLLVIYKSGILKDIPKLKWSKRLMNLISALGLAFVLSSFWWLRYGKIILKRIFWVALQEENRIFNNILYLPSILSVESLSYYFRSFYFLLGAIFIIFLFLSLIFMIIKVILKDKRSFCISYLLFWFIVLYIIYTFTSTKNTSHILSLLPSSAILISGVINFIKGKVFKVMLIILIALYCLYLHISSFYDFKIFSPLNRLTFMWRFHHEGYYSCLPSVPRRERVEFAIQEILKFIKGDSLGKEQPVVIVVSKRGELKHFVFEYYRMVGNYQFKIFFYNYPHGLSECDYIILENYKRDFMEEIIVDKFFAPDQEREGYKKLFKERLKGFGLIKVCQIPNGNSSIFIYKKKSIY